MNNGTDDSVLQIVNTLLHVGERVVEVSREQVMTRIWDREGSPLSRLRDHYIGKKIAEIRNDKTIAYCRAALEESFKTGRDSYLEYVSYNNDVDGVITYSLRILNCHPDKNYVFLVVDNISNGRDSKLIEDKWKLALDASQQGVWDANLEDKTIFFSAKWVDLFGYDATEVKTFSDWSSRINPKDVETAEEKMQDYFSGRSPVYSAELRYRCKDGSYKWILSRGLVIERKPDGSPLRFIGTHADISTHKQAENELREAKETFSNSFMYSGTGKALIAPGGMWLEVNNVVCQLTGYTKEELLKLHYRDITFPDDMDIDAELIQKLLRKEITSYSIEKRYVDRNRKILSTIVTVTLVWGNDGNPRYFVCDIVDMTKEKEVRDELKRRNRELETASVNLLNKINQLEELNGIIAHNLRGPIGNIKMVSEGNGVFTNEEAIKIVHESSLSLLENLDVMVEIARIRLDKEIKYDSCNVSLVIDHICQQLQGVIYQNHIKIVRKLAVEDISYPKLYLESILYNLISNAIKYRRKDVETVIEISTYRLGSSIHLSVRDNGLGIDMEKYGSKMFKLNQIFHEGFDSKGVGLFITKTQIESLGGSISVTGKPGQGCEFTVNFPEN